MQKFTVAKAAHFRRCVEKFLSFRSMIPDRDQARPAGRDIQLFEQRPMARSLAGFGGTGLGSPSHLTHLMVNLSVESRPDQGSRFTLRLPLQIADEMPRSSSCAFRSAELPRAMAYCAGRGSRHAPMLMTLMLERCKGEVIIARDGLEVIDMVATAERRSAVRF
jgi:hypothetical protein